MKIFKFFILSFVALIACSGALFATGPEAPLQVQVNFAYISTVTVTFLPVSGSGISYRIYTSTDNEATFIPIATTTALSYTFNYLCPAPPKPVVTYFTTAVSTYAITFGWTPAADPAQTNLYVRVSASSTVDGEGPLSDNAPSVTLAPQIASYNIFSPDDNNFVGNVSGRSFSTASNSSIHLLPNIAFDFFLQSVANDGQAIAKSDVHYFHTLAAQVAFSSITVTTSWNETDGLNNTVRLYTPHGSPNPNNSTSNTDYAVAVTNDKDLTQLWLTGDGTADSAPHWITSDTRNQSNNIPYTQWLHRALIKNTTYYYDVYARNRDGVINWLYQRSSTTTLDITLPQISSLSCIISSYPVVRTILTNESANALNPVFNWRLDVSSFTITAFQIAWSTQYVSGVSASTWSVILQPSYFNQVNISSNAYYSWTASTSSVAYIDPTTAQLYYVKIRAKDKSYTSLPLEFTYRFNPDHIAPAVLDSKVGVSLGALFNGTYYGLPLNGSITIPFSEAMSTTSLLGAGNVELIYLGSASGVSANTNIPLSPSNILYSPPGQSDASMVITAPLAGNSIYRVIVTTNCTDLVGNPMAAAYQKDFHTVIASTTVDTTIFISKTPKEQALITIPANTIALNSFVIYTSNPETTPITAAAGSITNANGKLSDQSALWYFECDLYGPNYAHLSTDLPNPVTISMSYADDDNDGFVDGTKILADKLTIWTLNEDRSYWMKTLSTVDKRNKLVRTTVSHLSTFALMGALSLAIADVKVFPTPWAPESGKPQLGNLTDGITFTGMPQYGDLYIYTIKGELVRHISIANPYSLFIQWNGKNDDGSNVASGVYLWEVKSSEASKTGKLVIIR